MYFENAFQQAKFLLLAMISVLLIASCYGQNQKLDSLKSLLPGRAGGENIDILFEIARESIKADVQVGLPMSKNAFEKAKHFGDSLRIVKTGRLYAQGLRRIGKHDSAEILFTAMLPVARRHAYRSEIKIILNALGVTHMQTSKYDDALKCLFETLELREVDRDTFQIKGALNNIGLVYMNLFDYEKALFYFDRAILLNNSLSLPFNERASAFLHKAICLINLERFSEGTELIHNVMSYCETSCSNEISIMSFQNLGEVSFYQNDFIQSKRHYLRSYELSKDSDYEIHHMGNLTGLIRVYIALNELLSAEVYLNEAEKIVEAGSSYRREMGFIYSQLISAYQKLNNLEKTSFYQTKYIALRDQIFNEQLATNLMKIEAEHLEKENRSKIEAQNKILTLNEEVMLRQKYLNVVIGVVALLLFALAFVLYRSNRQKQKLNFLLDSKVRERTQQLETSRNLLQRACDERDILMKKTASDVKQTLTTIKGLCLVGRSDIDSEHNYLEKVSLASDAIFDTINRLVPGKLV